MYLSPYVEEPLNSKIIKSFVPELRSHKCFSCFEIPLFYVYMLWTFHARFTPIRIMGKVHTSIYIQGKRIVSMISITEKENVNIIWFKEYFSTKLFWHFSQNIEYKRYNKQQIFYGILSFNQTGDIFTLNGDPPKLVDKFTYLGSSVSSIENDIDTWIANGMKSHR